MSQIEFYHNLYVSECWQKKKGKIVKRLKENKLQPQVYVITLSQETKSANARQFLLTDQAEYEKKGR